MWRPASALVLGSAVFASAAAACDTQSSAVGVYGPCERSGDCAGGLSCDAGVCVGPSPAASGPGAPADSGAGDTTTSSQ